MEAKDMHLQDLNTTDAFPTRDGFGQALLELGKSNERVVVLCADLAESTRTLAFKDAFPSRYIEIGVAEQNLATIAAGLAASGKIPFIASYAAFSPGRNYEQIRTTVALNHLPVKIAGMHAGVSVGPDGATHQMLEDIGLMRMLPNMTVISACDSEEARKATLAAAALEGPAYLRFGREKTPAITTKKTPFSLKQANLLFEHASPEVVIMATGALVHNALRAAHLLLPTIPVRVLNVHTIKPLDTASVLAHAKKAGAVVTVEEHQVAGGFGSAIAEVLSRDYPVPIQMVGVQNEFGQSGEPIELIRHYGMDVPHIIAAVKRVVKQKRAK